jgi:uncharacterized membrane protein
MATRTSNLEGNRRDDMTNPDDVFIYIGTYPNNEAAHDDYDVVKELHLAGAIGTYDAAVVTKDENGRVHVNKDEMAARHGAWGGAAAGALIGILFPPSIIGTALVGAAVGGTAGHLWRGLSRSDVKELGELIDDGEAALLIVGTSTLEEALEKADLKAEKHITKELDVNSKDIDSAVQELAYTS